MKRMGRPRKYMGADMAPVTAYLPRELVAQLDDMALNEQKNRNELVIFMLMSADKELTANLLQKFSDMNELLKTATQASSDYAQQLAKIQKTLASPANIYSALPADPAIVPLVQDLSERYQSKINEAKKLGNSLAPVRELFTGLVFDSLESEAVKEGRTITKPRLAQLMIQKELMKLE